MGITLLDVILVLVLIGFLAVGLRKGLWITVGGAAGFLVGAVAAFFAMPLVAEWVSDPVWRVVAVLAAAIVLVVAGHALGTTAGAEIQRLFRSARFQRRAYLRRTACAKLQSLLRKRQARKVMEARAKDDGKTIFEVHKELEEEARKQAQNEGRA